VRTVRSIPLSISKEKLKKAGIPVNFEVRASCSCPRPPQKVNEEREKNGLPTFAIPAIHSRNCRQLDPNITAERRMDYFHILLENGRTYFDRHSKTLDALEAAGFKVTSTASLSARWTKSGRSFPAMGGEARHAPYEIDGIVVKVDRTGLPG